MARPLRIEYPGAFYHIISRGNAGGIIFINDADCRKICSYLERAVERFAIAIHAYCLMTNHYHLIVETPNANISAAIQWINVSYAAYFNRKHGRQGHLFQGRFKSIIIDADEYLMHLSRYIHLNPVNAGIAEDPEGYYWSSYRFYLRSTNVPLWLERNRVLSYFAETERKAINRYRRFVENSDESVLDDPESQAAAGSILGNDAFVKWIQDTFLRDRKEDREIPSLKTLKPVISLDSVFRAVGEVYACEPEVMTIKGKKHNRARDVAIYLARDLTGLSGAELGRRFGGISGAAVTMAWTKVVRSVATDARLAREIEAARARILNI